MLVRETMVTAQEEGVVCPHLLMALMKVAINVGFAVATIASSKF